VWAAAGGLGLALGRDLGSIGISLGLAAQTVEIWTWGLFGAPNCKFSMIPGQEADGLARIIYDGLRGMQEALNRNYHVSEDLAQELQEAIELAKGRIHGA
jgi:hypothetical protein